MALAVTLLVGSTSAQLNASTADELKQREIGRRAIETVIWAVPAVNYDRMYVAGLEAGADKGQGGKYLILPPDYDGNIPYDPRFELRDQLTRDEWQQVFSEGRSE
jgi:hypothetical protein